MVLYILCFNLMTLIMQVIHNLILFLFKSKLWLKIMTLIWIDSTACKIIHCFIICSKAITVSSCQNTSRLFWWFIHDSLITTRGCKTCITDKWAGMEMTVVDPEPEVWWSSDLADFRTWPATADARTPFLHVCDSLTYVFVCNPASDLGTATGPLAFSVLMQPDRERIEERRNRR